MRAWTYMLAGLIVWTVHFFAVYIVASVFLTTPLARALALLVTLVCVAAEGWLLWRVAKARVAGDLNAWMRTLSLAGIGISILAVLWQGLPALLR